MEKETHKVVRDIDAKDLAPIVLFVYNRPEHTRRTIETLQNNELANESKLFIYSDAAKNAEDESRVKEVREYIRSIDGFAGVNIIEREKNWGLAASIIDGITSIVKQFGRIIVLEDDLVTSPFFLRFMNDGLRYYENVPGVMHISGWDYPIETDGPDDVFLWRVMNCWGWGTWADRWKYFEKDTDRLIEGFSKEDINSFNLDGVEDFWGQVLANREGRINSWAVYWYASIFKANGLCLNPVQSFVKNIGHDGSGENCARKESYDEFPNLSSKQNIKFPGDIYESTVYVERVKKYLRKHILTKIKEKVISVLYQK
ncbi:hypothetical protein BMS3Abin05_00047 [bacterium BMS3Abin05]|nr:hypothetical protein BMS3Abin05_00047 [bacterium BMS3Abin05]